MKKIKRWLKDVFDPENDIDMFALGQALGDPEVRNAWVINVLSEIRTMNIDVDKALLAGTDFRLIDLCARRKAFKDVLEMILSARRVVAETLAQEVRPNPRKEVPFVNLDRVTA